MKKTVELEEIQFDLLSKEDQQFLEKAKIATTQSYAPYSEFYVGCIVGLTNGNEVTGANQENASFPSGLCAERVALFECAKNLDAAQIKKMAIFAKSTRYKVPTPLVPCAACLQVISDIRNRQKAPIEVWMWDGSKIVHKASDVSAFLPFHFELKK